jgi:hypothetical protein
MPLAKLRAIGFPTTPGFYPLISPTPKTPWINFRIERTDAAYAFTPVQSVPRWFHVFSPPARGAFQLSLTLLLRYRSQVVFRVTSLCLVYSRAISNARYSLHQDLPSSHHYGTITLYGASFQRTLCYDGRVYLGPTSPRSFQRGFGSPCCVFCRPYSHNRYCFLFLCLLRCFNSAGYLSLMRMSLLTGGPIRLSPVQRLLAPTRSNIAAWHDLLRLLSLVIPHLGCSNLTEIAIFPKEDDQPVPPFGDYSLSPVKSTFC